MFFMGVFVAYPAEQAGNPILEKLGIETPASGTQSGGNMEGKETRFGISGSALFTTVTTDASCGAVNSMHDSYTPLGGLVPLFNIQTGEVIFGGVGAGLYGILLYAILAVFIAGLMVGRTPEYIGKKIEQKSEDGALRHPGHRLLHPRGRRHQHGHSVCLRQFLEPGRSCDREPEQRGPARIE
jgi:K+-transporting ATPase ATPase A chain